MNVLLVNPPIYDFTAFDFWLRPYGLLRVGGQLRTCNLTAFDYLDSRDRDGFGRGRFDRTLVARPAALADIPRRFYRFGRSREDFQRLLAGSSFDVVLVQTVMTYWYLGVREVIEDIRNVGLNPVPTNGSARPAARFTRRSSPRRFVPSGKPELRPLPLTSSSAIRILRNRISDHPSVSLRRKAPT